MTTTTPHGSLTVCEAEALRMAAHGFGVAESARLLSKGYETVRRQRATAIRRLEARTLTHAVYLATKSGLLEDVVE